MSAWMWLVRKTRDSKPFFFAFATVCGVVPGVIGYCVMQLTNSGNEHLEAKLRQNARPDSLMMGRVNKERLGEFLGELQRKEDTNDRYVAALRGETLTRNHMFESNQCRIKATQKKNKAQISSLIPGFG